MHKAIFIFKERPNSPSAIVYSMAEEKRLKYLRRTRYKVEKKDEINK